jgi:FkbM family methyltransferase
MFGNCDSTTNGERRFYTSIKQNISVIFDVGCRSESEFIDFTGEVHYFDPVKSFIDSLSAKPNSNSASFFNTFGLGDKNTDLYYYPKYESFNDRIISCGVSDNAHAVMLNIKTAHDYITEKQVVSIDFLKIDTEGYELKVLQGFGDALSRVKLIQFEYGGTFQDNNTKLIDVVDYLKKHGFVDFSYLTPTGLQLINDFRDHYRYCNIVCRRSDISFQA